MLPIDLIALPYQITLKDNRSLQGTLVAIDDQLNLLMANVSEQTGPHSRHLGLVSVPKKTIASILVDKSEYAKANRYRQQDS
ncbi:hypothetical protein OGAPHI_006283 [Ogataea philodendri]|uniref:Sm domain-containing protein n=1 Tax=Ogataea philodendri TaxID=1378263 RepID=A0A9P8NYV4_9ASCO|nr:uncharacterized protein OGAPHI_006283 [Ogataea philodendri]KAH3662102.1 hypothetical protein OGAPHI_006283 [Ogataea philodendri]